MSLLLNKGLIMIKGIKSSNIYFENQSIKKGTITFVNERISLKEEDGEYLQLDDKYIVLPGFIDEHIHGCNNHDAMDGSVEDIRVIASSLPREGVTSFLATTMTMDNQSILKSLSSIKDYIENYNNDGAKVLGIHLEGPFISASNAGAQDVKNIVKFDKKLFDNYLSVSNNHIKQVTFAYEENGSEMVKYLVSKNIVASIGHTICTSDLLEKGINEGISCSTHTYNAMKGIHHREIGTVGQVMLNDNINCELICDLHHVSLDAIKLLFKAKGKDKIILISDSMRAKYLSDGEYTLGGFPVFVKDCMAKLKDGTLAGSILKLNDALKNIKNPLNLSIEEASDLVSKNPSKNLSLYHEIGSIKEGKYADLTIVDKDFNVYMTIVHGHIVYNDLK